MNHTGRTSVGRRRQASRKRLVIGATRINYSPELRNPVFRHEEPGRSQGTPRWSVPLTNLAHQDQEIAFFSGLGRPRLILLRIWGALAAKSAGRSASKYSSGVR